jgi:hypothetical protein
VAALDYLFQGAPPPGVTTSAVATNGLPEWYAQYLQGIAAKGTEIAGSDRPIPLQSVAGLSEDEKRAQQMLRDNSGAWQGHLGGALHIANAVLPKVEGAVGNANAAVAGPTGNFTSSYEQYMSPYTKGVVDNIGRLGQRNFEERIMPGINGSMIGTGQFGSTRNAEVLANAGRDAAADITGQQAAALDAGYNSAAGIFASDQARAQQQGQMQAGTSLAGANALASSAQAAAQQQGAITQAWQQGMLADAQALDAAGRSQRQVTQAGYDTAYGNQQAINNAPWTDINNLNSVVRGMQLPETRTAVSTAPATAYQPGALQQVGTAYGLMRS